MPSPCANDEEAHAGEPIDQITANVFACVLDFELVFVRTDDGHQYALTRQTAGVLLENLREGERVACVVTRRMPRVLTAQVLE